MAKETGERTEEGFSSGDELYQQRARKALPILVRQAIARTPIFYSDLASRLDMPNPRNLNYVLGAVGGELNLLAAKWEEYIPPLSCIVVNKQDGLPGNGIGWFVSDKKEFKRKPLSERKRIVDKVLLDITEYRKWPEVLAVFGMQPAPVLNPIEVAAIGKAVEGASGEGERHRHLKEYVAAHPVVVKLNNTYSAVCERCLPSADRMDIFFSRGSEWVGVEIKSSTSNDDDLARGLFQAVKYDALMKAEQKALQLEQNARVVLVAERKLPSTLEELRTVLGVEICYVTLP